MPLGNLVSDSTLYLAGFNEWGEDFIYSRFGRVRNVYLSRIDEANMNLALIEIMNGKRGSNWYFGVFSGKPLRACTNDEREKFYDSIDEFVTLEHRVSKEHLDDAIRSAVQRIRPKSFAVPLFPRNLSLKGTTVRLC